MVLVLVYTLAGFLLAPLIVRHQLETILSDTLQRPVTVERVRINPYALSVAVEGFRLAEPEGEDIARFQRLYINFQTSSLFNRAWTFAEISLKSPEINLVRRASGEINLLALIPPAGEQAEDSEPASLPALLFHRLAIVDGTVHGTDRTRSPAYTTTFNPLNLDIRNLGTLEGRLGEHSIELQGESGIRLTLGGQLSVTPLSLQGTVRATGPYPEEVHQYFQELLTVDVTGGELDMDLDYAISEGQDGITVAVTSPRTAINDLRLVDAGSGEAMLALDRIALDDLAFSWPDRQLAIRQLSVGTGQLALARDRDGVINWTRLLASGGNDDEGEGAATSQGEPPDGEAATAPLPDWDLRLDRFALEGLAITLADQALAEPANLAMDVRSLSLEGIANRVDNPMAAQLSVGAAGGGSLEFSGDLTLFPPWQLTGQLAVDDLALPPFDPYLGNYLNASLKSGTLSLASSVESHPESLLSAAADLAVAELDVRTSPDDRPLVQWQNLDIKGLELGLSPLAVQVGRINLNRPYLRFRINEDQTTNFHHLTDGRAPAPEQAAGDGDAAAEAAQPAPAQPLALTMDELTIADATVDFADYSLPIPFDDRLSKLQGQLSRLSTVDKEAGSLTLAGQVAEYGSVDVTGRVSPWDFTADSELALVMKNIDMPSLKPYSIKFVGREIRDGKLNLNLDYQFRDGKVDGDNNIVLTRFELGDRVPQEGALDLPLDLAVALLKGPDGTIDLDLPVSGNTNDPSFSIGGVILKVFSNLITKAVTAPFRLLGALVGASGEDFDRIHFQPGSANIAPPELEKLHQLATALNQRPQLGLTVKGAYHEASDVAALREAVLDERIATAREQQFGDDSRVPAAEQRLRVMEGLLADSDGDALAILRETHGADMDAGNTAPYRDALRRRLTDTIAVEQDRLEALARQRASNIQQALTADDRLAPDRLALGDIAAVDRAGKSGIPLLMDVSRIDE